MKLPDTDNAHHHYAFKKGYRLALDGKPLSHMPSQIKLDPKMRGYFQMGWEQLQEELKNGQEDQQRTPWRQRAAWYLMMLLAGIGTASLMISEKMEAQQQQQQKIDHPQDSAEKPPGLVVSKPEITPESLSLTFDDPAAEPQEDAVILPPQPEMNKPSLQKPDRKLGLLTSQQRQDLQQTQKQHQQQSSAAQVDLSPVISSPIQVTHAQLGQTIQNKQLMDPFDGIVPKYIRKVAFFTEIKNAQNQTLYHRWVYKNQTMATVALKIESPLYRTWSSKQLTSAWEGDWRIDVLNDKKDVIFRHHFRYGR